MQQDATNVRPQKRPTKATSVPGELGTAESRALAYLEENPGKKLTIARVARAIGVDTSTLYKAPEVLVAWRIHQQSQVRGSNRYLLSTLQKTYVAFRPDLKPGSADQLLYSVNSFDRFLERQSTIADLTDETLIRFMSWRLGNGSQKTVRRERGNLCTLWRFAARKKLSPSPPAEGIPTVKVTRRNAIAWTLAEVTKILAACDQLEGRIRSESDRRRSRFVRDDYTGPLQSQWWASLVLFAFDTGTRVGAMLQIAPSDIDLERGLVTLRGEVAKTGLEQVLRLSSQTVTAIRAIYDPQAKVVWSWNSARRDLYLKLSQILKRAGLPHDRYRKFHCLRRTTATLTAAAGRRDLAQTTLGHTTPTMTDGYIDKRALPIESAANVLPRPAWGDNAPQTSLETPSVSVVEALRELSPDQLVALLRLAATLTATVKTPA